MDSFISPVRPVDTAVPWNWNPAATFQTAFTLAQENKRAQEKAAVEMELEQILLPVKQKQAALALDKMQFEVERQSLLLDKQRTATKQASRGLNGEISGGSDAESTGPDGKYKSQYGFGLGMKTQTTPAARPKVSWKVVTPAAPTTPQTGS